MKYLLFAILFILAVSGVHFVIVKLSPDRSVESGLKRVQTEDQSIQAEEDNSVWDVQRNNNNNVPRHP